MEWQGLLDNILDTYGLYAQAEVPGETPPVVHDRDDDGHAVSESIVRATTLGLSVTSDDKGQSVAGGASSRGSSYYAAIATCPKMWNLRYRRGLITRWDPPYRMGGTLIHRALAHYWAARMNPQPAWHQSSPAYLHQELATLGRGYPSLVEKALQCYDAYEAHYSQGPQRPDLEWIPISAESVFSATIDEIDPPGDRRMSDDERAVGSELVTCRPDLLYIVANGQDGRTVDGLPRIRLCDHKTEGNDWSGGFKRTSLKVWDGDGQYTISWQQMLYLHILRVRFGADRVAGATIQRVRRESPYLVERHPLEIQTRPYNEVPRTLRHVAAMARRIGMEAAEGTAPVSYLWSCETRWGPCDYRALCATHSVDDALVALRGLYVELPKRENT